MQGGQRPYWVMIASFLIHDRFFTDADDALAFCGFARTNDMEGVTIPSQRAYVHYYAKLKMEPTLIERVSDKSLTYLLLRVKLLMLPASSVTSRRDVPCVLACEAAATSMDYKGCGGE